MVEGKTISRNPIDLKVKGSILRLSRRGGQLIWSASNSLVLWNTGITHYCHQLNGPEEQQGKKRFAQGHHAPLGIEPTALGSCVGCTKRRIFTCPAMRFPKDVHQTVTCYQNAFHNWCCLSWIDPGALQKGTHSSIKGSYTLNAETSRGNFLWMNATVTCAMPLTTGVAMGINSKPLSPTPPKSINQTTGRSTG